MSTAKMVLIIVGIVLIVIAVILGGIQVSHAHNFYGAAKNKWYFYGGVIVIGIVGIILAVWGVMKKEVKKGMPMQPPTMPEAKREG